MRRLHYFGWRQRKGIALLLVMFIAFASLILLTTLYSSLAPRSISVRGQAQSDRALAMADGTIDRLMNQINDTGLTYSVAAQDTAQAATKALVTKLLLDINGGLSSDPYETVVANIRRYFYDIQTDTYYRLESGSAATGTLTNLSTGSPVTGLSNEDSTYLTDNRWFELDANAKYWYDPNKPDTWEIGVTAFNMSNPDIKRTIRAEAKREEINTSTVSTANGNWYVPKPSTDDYFSDYSGLYHSRVNFGQFEVVTGYVRSDSNLWMGGWAKDIASAAGSVNDMAIDDNNRHDGRFGLDAVSLSLARSQGLVIDGVGEAKWPKGGDALTTLWNQSKSTAYYVNGNATIVFSVVGGVGMVTINNVLLPMPPVTYNVDGVTAIAGGSIYVNGDATVSGEVKGKVTIGANDDIFIGGNITYSNPPRTDMNADPVDAALQDKLGLIARSDIIIPPSTYNHNQTLEIDAAMLAVQGYFGLDVNANYTWHDINSSPHWVGIWSGSQSIYGSGSAPAISSGHSVKGYEEQHTNYDYNLRNGARPPFFPAADDTHTPVIDYDDYTGPYLATLQALTQSQLTPVTSGNAYAKGMRFSYYLNSTSTTYYCSSPSSWHTSYGASVAALDRLYRVSWKEEIAQPVGGN
jgi:hypothetical protein